MPSRHNDLLGDESKRFSLTSKARLDDLERELKARFKMRSLDGVTFKYKDSDGDKITLRTNQGTLNAAPSLS